jgi:hypothetical protein
MEQAPQLSFPGPILLADFLPTLNLVTLIDSYGCIVELP